MEEFNYTLIISQYYHSRHSYIVKHDSDTFLDTARKFAAELMEYKRGDPQEWLRPINESLGDLIYRPDNKIRSRYNINDSGDIYFIQSKYANYCKCIAVEYADDSRREAIGFKRKEVLNKISERHNRDTVKAIVEKYFEIA